METRTEAATATANAVHAETLPELPEIPAAVALPDMPEPPPYEGHPFFMAGRSWLVPPLNLQQARALDGYVRAIGSDGLSADAKMQGMLNVIRIAMQRNYPALTAEHMPTLIDMGNVGAVFAAVLGQSGFRERAMRLEASP